VVLFWKIQILVQCHRGCGPANVTNSSAMDSDDNELRTLMFHSVGEKLSTASKSKIGAPRLSEKSQACAASHRDYGATSAISHHGDQPPDLLTHGTQKHIPRVFQVNRIIKKLYTKTCVGGRNGVNNW